MWSIKIASREVWLDGSVLFLSPLLFNLLVLFARSPRVALSLETIGSELGSSGDVRLMVHRLRILIPNGKVWFQAIRHRGYYFAALDREISWG